MAHILFPLALETNERGDFPGKMKIIRQFLFVTVMIIGFSIAASAQQNQDKKKETPPKKDVPTIDVVIKNDEKSKEKPKEDKKKPTAYLNGYLENKPILCV